MTVEPDFRTVEDVSGALRPEIQAILDLPDAAKAHDLVEAGHGRGKVVLRVAGGA